MNKKNLKNLITILTISGIALFWLSPVFANGLVVEFEKTPLFDEANFLPGQSITRWVKVINNTGETQSIATEAINFPGFPYPADTATDDLSRVLSIIIREQGGSDLYGGLTGEKTLFNFYEHGEIYLSDILNSEFKEYEFEISFPQDKSNDWQEKTTGFDILVGIQGDGGGNGGNGGNGGGGGAPRGLTIREPIEVTPTTNSAEIIWLTNYFSTSQVVYAAENESYSFDLTQPNYGYPHAFPDPEDYTKVTAHSVTILGLESGTTYYYRCISHGSFAMSTEHSFTTPNLIGEEKGEEESVYPEVPTDSQPVEQEPVVAGVSVEKGEDESRISFTNFTEIEEETEEDKEISGKFFAAVGDLFGLISPCLVLFILIIILIISSLLSIKEKDKSDKNKKKWWILNSIIAIIIILYYFVCPFSWYHWLVIFLSVVSIVLLALFRKK